MSLVTSEAEANQPFRDGFTTVYERAPGGLCVHSTPQNRSGKTKSVRLSDSYLGLPSKASGSRKDRQTHTHTQAHFRLLNLQISPDTFPSPNQKSEGWYILWTRGQNLDIKKFCDDLCTENNFGLIFGARMIPNLLCPKNKLRFHLLFKT